MKAKIIGVLCFLLVVPCAHAETAAESDSAKAKTAYEQGMARFQLEEYDAAIGKWEEGFRIRPVPEFLYNIAQAHRLAQRHDKALSFYQRYLRMNPKAKNRQEVEKHIATLKPLVDAQRSAAAAPPRESVPPSVSASPSPTPNVNENANATVSENVSTPAPVAIVERAPAKKSDARPIYKKGWFWGVIGGSAVVVVAAVVVGVVLGTRADGPRILPAVQF